MATYQNVKKAISAAALFVLIFGFYGYSFFWGGYLRYNDIKNGDDEYTGGVVLAIMFSVVFGGFNLGGATPHIASVTEGKIAGKLAFDVIDHKPAIDQNDPNSKQLVREKVEG